MLNCFPSSTEGAPRLCRGGAFRKLAIQKESRIEERHLMPDHEHMRIRIPPKYAVSQVIGFIEGVVVSTSSDSYPV